MSHDEPLRDRIARTDPTLGHATPAPMTDPGVRALLENIMSTPLDDTPKAPAIDAEVRRPRRWWANPTALVSAAALAIGLVAVGVVLTRNGDDGPATADPAVTTAPSGPGKLTVLELSAGDGGGGVMQSCIRLDPTIIAQAPVAFKGTVTMAEGGVVQLTVDQAYAGVDAGAVTITSGADTPSITEGGGVDWQVGQQYLVSAYDGVVSYCGQTGPADPDLQAIYDAAFPA